MAVANCSAFTKRKSASIGSSKSSVTDNFASPAAIVASKRQRASNFSRTIARLVRHDDEIDVTAFLFRSADNFLQQKNG